MESAVVEENILEEMWIQIMSYYIDYIELFIDAKELLMCVQARLCVFVSNMQSFHRVYDCHKIVHSLSTNAFLKRHNKDRYIKTFDNNKRMYNESGLHLPFLICPAKPSTNFN